MKQHLFKDKIKKMVTDPNKIMKGDSGNPDICSVFQIRKSFALHKGEYQAIADECKEGKLGCYDCKFATFKTIQLFDSSDIN